MEFIKQTFLILCLSYFLTVLMTKLPQPPVIEDAEFIETKLKANIYNIANYPSEVWNHFGLIERKNSTQSQFEPERASATAISKELIDGYAACRHCKSVLVYNSKSGTSHMQRHINVCNKRQLKSTSQSQSQPTIEQSLIRKVNQIDKEKINKAAVAFRCIDLRPFSAIEGEGIENIL